MAATLADVGATSEASLQDILTFWKICGKAENPAKEFGRLRNPRRKRSLSLSTPLVLLQTPAGLAHAFWTKLL